MTLGRWAIAFLQLGLLLLAVGALPAVAMGIFAPSANALVPALLSLTVAPLGVAVLAVGAIMWIVALLKR
ncbi:hypothetical protein [Pelagibacterium halotolerans]|uniref:hypothetical protein n=1 Tax=Pelagibacterium halotolerans TaxID=531813 RepID=UPI00385137DF